LGKRVGRRKYYSDDQLHQDMVGGACSTYGGEEKFIKGFGGEKLKERNHLEDQA